MDEIQLEPVQEHVGRAVRDDEIEMEFDKQETLTHNVDLNPTQRSQMTYQ